jgi:hypothetical protein
VGLIRPLFDDDVIANVADDVVVVIAAFLSFSTTFDDF